jgi:hypothetical protein
VFESLKARLEHLLRADSRSDSRARAALLREALLEAKVGISTMKSGLLATQDELLQERRRLEDTERRGKLATEVPDPETVALAERYAQRHRERIAVLERKLTVQQDELAIAERETQEMLLEFRSARTGAPFESVEAAWRDLEAAGGERPVTGLGDEATSDLSADKLKQAVEAQLAYLKKKLGKQP